MRINSFILLPFSILCIMGFLYLSVLMLIAFFLHEYGARGQPKVDLSRLLSRGSLLGH